VANKPVNLLFSGSANATGTTLDLGAAPGANLVNYQVSAPGTVTALQVTIQGSADNFTTPVQVAVVNNVTTATGTVRLPTGYRYWRAVLASYAGSGTVKCTTELAYRH
jgi:hypothetical protein